ncbi:MAG TPA: potassium transporter [Gammaproteobacteria bacterium]|nr:potassium transporter [Gammaproteobacteria bacterium]
MRIRPVLSVTGILTCIFSISVVPPMLISQIYHDGESDNLLVALLIILGAGIFMWIFNHREPPQIHRQEGFLIVVLFWIILGTLGALPFMFSLDIRFVDALFESVSGLTTTGATVLDELDTMQPSILFYRQEIQWFGGMGLVVLAVAILPILGIGGMSLYRAEIPGPMKEEKMLPRLSSSSRSLWLLYVIITVACAFAYWVAGMSTFDAISHSLSTVSTGGFSTHDDSLGYFHSATIESIAIAFMVIGAINFGVHYTAFRHRAFKPYRQDTEVRGFLLFIGLATSIITLGLWFEHYYGGVISDLRNAVFEVVSVITSTGFGTVDFTLWPVMYPTLLITISFIGGCGGSTAGGMKVLRILILFRLGYREIVRLPHPRGVFPIKLNGRAIPESTLQSVLGFFSVYIASFALLMLLMMMTGLDQVSAYSAIATCINNLGPGLGEVAQSFSGISDTGKIISVIAMLLGRLEIFSVLVLLHPDFWRDA